MISWRYDSFAENGKRLRSSCSKSSRKIEKERATLEMSPQMYEALVAATAGMGLGSCADCEHCRNGVKIHNTDE